MSRYQSLGYAKLSFQNTWGNVDTTSAWGFPIISENLTEKINRLNRSSFGSFFKRSSLTGKKFVDGTVSFNADILNITHGLKSVLNQYTNLSSGSNYYYYFDVHSQDYNQFAATTPLTLEINKDDSDSYFFYDLIGNNLNIVIESQKLVKCELSLLGRNYTKTTKTALSYLNPLPDPIKWDQASVSFNGVGVPDVLNMNISFNNNLEVYYTLQACSYPYKIKRTIEPEILISGQMLVQNNSMYTDYRNQNNIRCLVNFSSGLSLEFPNLEVLNFSDPKNDNGVYKADFSLQAFYHQSSESVLKATVINTYTLRPSFFILNDSYFGLLDQTYNVLL